MTGHLLDDPTFSYIGVDPATHPCFFCGQPLALGSGVILWYGAGDLLTLHQGCAEALAVRLIQDAAVVKVQAETIVRLQPTTPSPNPKRCVLVRRSQGETSR